MADTMIDRVAQALGCQTGMDLCRSDEWQHPETCSECVAAARRAIEAMRDPTAAMIRVAATEGVGADFWNAMIDAALST